MNNASGEAGDQWYIARGGSHGGPFTDVQIRTWAANGQISAEDLVWRSGWTEWKPAKDVFPVGARQAPPPLPPLSNSAKNANLDASRTISASARPTEGASSPAFSGLLLTAAGVLGGILDFLKPVTDEVFGFSGMAAYFGIGLLGLIASLICRSLGGFERYANELKAGAVLCAGMATVAAYPTFASGFDVEVAQRGVLASHIPVFSTAQDRLLGRVEKIGQSVDRVERTLESVRSTTEDISFDTKKISEKVGTLKRETSQDPRKELANLGVSWGRESFLDAFMHQDKRGIELFMAGGYRPIGQDVYKFMTSRFDPGIANILAGYPDQLPREICSTRADIDGIIGWNQDSIILNIGNDVEKKKFYFGMCSPSDLRKLYASDIVIEGASQIKLDKIKEILAVVP